MRPKSVHFLRQTAAVEAVAIFDRRLTNHLAVECEMPIVTAD